MPDGQSIHVFLEGRPSHSDLGFFLLAGVVAGPGKSQGPTMERDEVRDGHATSPSAWSLFYALSLGTTNAPFTQIPTSDLSKPG